MDAGGYGIDAGAKAEEVEFLVLLADGVLSVDFGDVGVTLGDRLSTEYLVRQVLLSVDSRQ